MDHPVRYGNHNVPILNQSTAQHRGHALRAHDHVHHLGRDHHSANLDHVSDNFRIHGYDQGVHIDLDDCCRKCQ